MSKCNRVQLNRRQLLTIGGTSLLLSPFATTALCMGKSSLLQLAMLDDLTSPIKRASGVERLLWETTKRTSILADEMPATVSLKDDSLYQYPLIIWCGRGEIRPIGDSEFNRLRHYLRLGGMLFVDDASPMGDDRFHRSFGPWLERLWPDDKLVRMPKQHTFYKTFYLLNGARGRLNRDSALYALDFEDRSPIIYSRNDLFGALCRDQIGGWALPMRSAGNQGRESAFRFGVNLLMYSTCLNYKRDQVHVPALLKRRKWRVE